MMMLIAIGHRSPAIVPIPFDMPISILAYLGAMSKWLTLNPESLNISTHYLKSFRLTIALGSCLKRGYIKPKALSRPSNRNKIMVLCGTQTYKMQFFKKQTEHHALLFITYFKQQKTDIFIYDKLNQLELLSKGF